MQLLTLLLTQLQTEPPGSDAEFWIVLICASLIVGGLVGLIRALFGNGDEHDTN